MGGPFLWRSARSLEPGGKLRGMARTIAFLVLAMVAAGWAEPRVIIGNIQWYTDYDVAMKVAREQQKPLWIHFGEDPG